MLVTIIDDLGVLNSSQFRDFPSILTKVKIFTIENLVLPKLGCTWKNVMLSFCPVLGSTMMTFKSLLRANMVLLSHNQNIFDNFDDYLKKMALCCTGVREVGFRFLN